MNAVCAALVPAVWWWLNRTRAGLTLRARHDTFWPCHLERVPAGVWLELSSLGASHFEVLALPDLRLLESGNLKYCPLQFPPEQIRQAVYALAQFSAALRTGVRPDGRKMEPQYMPWSAFSAMTDTEVEALYRYLGSLPAADHRP